MKSRSKYIILVGDGMADEPIAELGGRTPLQAAFTPNMDFMAQNGVSGKARTVPEGMLPGSDTANLSIFGYDPRRYFTGRAPLEALNMGIPLEPCDAAFRCNIVSIMGGLMEDFSADHIESGFSAVIMKELAAGIIIPGIEFYPGVSYRNLMVWRDYPHAAMPETTPPHDITDREVSGYMPRGEGSDVLNRIMERSVEIIARSPAVAEAGRRFKGRPVSAWLWGGGHKPAVKSLRELHGLEGYTISAVDLIHGIGRAAGLEPLPVPGATGYIDTDYEGKADACIAALESASFVFLHVESPDESGHEGNLAHKLQSIEDFDRLVVGRVLSAARDMEDCTVLVMPDHPTPIRIRTHSSDPVPFAIFKTRPWPDALSVYSAATFDERAASETGLVLEGHRLLDLMISSQL